MSKLVKLRDYLSKEGFTFEHVTIEYDDGSIERTYLEDENFIITESVKNDTHKFVLSYWLVDSAISFAFKDRKKILNTIEAFYEVN